MRQDLGPSLGTEDLSEVLKTLCTSLKHLHGDVRVKKAIINLYYAAILLNHHLQVCVYYVDLRLEISYLLFRATWTFL
jgi:hypothetical protein